MKPKAFIAVVAFTAEPQCSKCLALSRRIHRRYRRDAQGEWIAMTCQCCQWSWRMRPADSALTEKALVDEMKAIAVRIQQMRGSTFEFGIRVDPPPAD